MDYVATDSGITTVDKTHLTGMAYYLFQDGLLDVETAKKTSQQANEKGLPFISYLVKNKILSSEIILQSCEKNFGLGVFDLKNYDHDWLNDTLIKLELICRYRVLPLNKNDNSLYLGMTDPTDHTALEAIRFHTGLRIHPMLIDDNAFETFIQTHYGQNLLNSQLELALKNTSSSDIKNDTEENSKNNDEPVIKFVDQLIQDAIQKSVSDIHIEPYQENCRIRYRRDGLLYEVAIIPHHLFSRLITRLKIMSRLDIAEKRLPQDGRFQLNQELKIDIRINTCPTLFGEKIVLRLLDTKKMTLDINQLGLNDKQKKLFLEKISRPQGLILVTGPTGSGKTVTLYSALQHINHPEKNIVTVEDPIEIQLPCINQVNVNPKIGLNFSTVLRTFLRQDPDIILVGEIRDTETANIAMQAAQTGHLVLSTLHTNNAIETVNRLQSMGIVPYQLISSVSLIIAQRLVRKLCIHCKEPETQRVDANALPSLVYQPIGCQYCYHGYQGRIGIFELIPMTDTLASLILSRAEIPTLTNQIKIEGLTLLWESGLEKIGEGITSLSEINRVIIK